MVLAAVAMVAAAGVLLDRYHPISSGIKRSILTLNGKW